MPHKSEIKKLLEKLNTIEKDLAEEIKKVNGVTHFSIDEDTSPPTAVVKIDGEGFAWSDLGKIGELIYKLELEVYAEGLALHVDRS